MRVTIFAERVCVMVVLSIVYIAVDKYSGIESNNGATDLT
jgi:hypothetical protein